MCISVIIPSYNRAHLLQTTIPTYFQEGVGEVIIIDDCSTDNTQEIVKNLQKDYPTLRYLRNEKNSKQPFAKNVGILNANYPLIYFGDDDSVLQKGSIATLRKIMKEKNADIVGGRASALFFEYQLSNIDEFLSHYKNRIATTSKQLVDVSSMTTNFTYTVQEPMRVPFCQASCLCKTKIARQLLFDENYIGNAYREETDFLIRATMAGYVIYYTSDANQINLPTSISTGGARSKSHIKWARNAVRNNDYFLDKNYASMRTVFRLRKGINYMKILFRVQICKQVIIKYLIDILQQTGVFPSLYKIKHKIWKR